MHGIKVDKFANDTVDHMFDLLKSESKLSDSDIKGRKITFKVCAYEDRVSLKPALKNADNIDIHYQEYILDSDDIESAYQTSLRSQ